VLDKAEYSAFQSTLNSSIVSYRIVSYRNPVLLQSYPVIFGQIYTFTPLNFDENRRVDTAH